VRRAHRPAHTRGALAASCRPCAPMMLARHSKLPMRGAVRCAGRQPLPCWPHTTAASSLRRGLHSSRPCAGVWQLEVERDDGTAVPGLGFGDMLESDNPGVIVLQEWWGITPEIQGQAEKIASQGYRVIVPDLYRGKLGVDAEEASHLMDNLDWAGAIEDIRATANTLDEDGNGRVGVVGFCMGGALSLASGALVDSIDCAISFYGTPDPSLVRCICFPGGTQANARPLQTHHD
jgi:hypothetical protein